MKLANYLILTAVLIFGVNCSTAVKTTVENTNSNAQNSTSAASQTGATPAGQPAVAPDAVVKDLYAQHDKKNSPFFQTKNVDKYFDKKLADLIWKDANNSKGEVGVIDGDPLYNAQDTDIKNFSVGQPKIENSRAKVVASFENFGKKYSITYELVQKDSDWKIEDINYGDSTLLGWFKDSAKSDSKAGATSADGNFEGTYQVGDTTCTVKPVKMAFEVKWAKGSGSEMFFSQGRANDRMIFASEVDEGEKANSFAFDDENYTTGTFYRGDGKEFDVKKIK